MSNDVAERVSPICGKQHTPVALGLTSLAFAAVALAITVLITALVGWQIGLLALLAEVNVVLALIMLDAYHDERNFHG